MRRPHPKDKPNMIHVASDASHKQSARRYPGFLLSPFGWAAEPLDSQVIDLCRVAQDLCAISISEQEHEALVVLPVHRFHRQPNQGSPDANRTMPQHLVKNLPRRAMGEQPTDFSALMVNAEPTLLADLFEMSQPRMHLIALGLAHLQLPQPPGSC
jgi:hypothetical protein